MRGVIQVRYQVLSHHVVTHEYVIYSSLDEGLQTPNSTVDNLITKEFAQAVLTEQQQKDTKR